jgi:hypothetical protein
MGAIIAQHPMHELLEELNARWREHLGPAIHVADVRRGYAEIAKVARETTRPAATWSPSLRREVIATEGAARKTLGKQ